MSKQVSLTDNNIAKTSDYAVMCPVCAGTYSATSGDYFMARDTTPMTCEHDGENVPCNLVQRALIGGVTSEGQPFYGTVRLIVKEAVTVGDLRALVSNF